MRARVLGLVLVSGLLAAVGASAADWTQFRGPGGTGVSDEKKLPEEWSKDKNIAWKVEVPGVGWSCPIVVGDKVFVTTAVSDKQAKPRPFEFGKGGFPPPGGGKSGFPPPGGGFPGGMGKAPDAVYKWQVICLDRTTGKTLWTKTPLEKKPAIPTFQNNGYATETPVSDGERVYAYFGAHGLFCFDLDGNQLWDKDLGSYKTQNGFGTGSSPVLGGDRLFIQYDNDEKSFLIALDKKTGKELWKKERPTHTAWATPLYWKNKVRSEVVCLGAQGIRSYDPANGDLLWEMTWGGRGYGAASPVADEERVYFGSGGPFGGSPLYAVKAGAKGDITIKGSETSSEFVAWSQRGAAPSMASPLVYDGYVYTLEQRGGQISCYEAKTGKVVYSRERLSGSRGFTSSPWAGDGKVYCIDENGQTFVIKAGPDFKLLSTNKLDEMFWSSPAVANGNVLLRGSEHLYCIK